MIKVNVPCGDFRWAVLNFCGFLLLVQLFHHLFASALRANNILAVLYKAFADHGLVADVAEEALVVPRQRLERHELCAAQTALACNWFSAGSATL